MIVKSKKQFFSENGMKIVNTLFLLSAFLPNPMLTLCASAVWLIFLVYSIRAGRSKGLRIWYAVLSILAVLLAGCSLCRLLMLY